jgi:hypothetical protein
VMPTPATHSTTRPTAEPAATQGCILICPGDCVQQNGPSDNSNLAPAGSAAQGLCKDR